MMTDNSFTTLGLEDSWIRNLDQLGYVQMTPIQADALPLMLDGRDVIGLASTGSGKTAAFGLGLLSCVTPGGDLPGALVLCPTRELAAQVADEIRRLARPLANTNVVVITGGASSTRQRESLKHGVDIVVGTPGRVLDMVKREHLNLSHVQVLVLDEADRMLDMGFVDDVISIVESTPERRQTLLFSATISDDVKHLSERLQQNATMVSVAGNEAGPDIEQLLYRIGSIDRFDALHRVLGFHKPESAVIFCAQRDTVDEVLQQLNEKGYSAMGLHGGLEQRDREDVLRLFANGSVRLMVATNVAARGIDINDLNAVINYELPRDVTEFVHRVGRTGRAGESGLAVSLMGPNDDKKIERIELLADVEPISIKELPEPTERPPLARMKTIVLRAGRKDKVRPGDIVGALCGSFGIEADSIGDISVGDRIAHIAIERSVASKALSGIQNGKIKKRSFKARFL
jgi:ATP-independent RNA helicase DbpA